MEGAQGDRRAALQDLCEDYSELVLTALPAGDGVSGSAEEALSRLDEAATVMGQVRSDVALATDTLLPQLARNAAELEELFGLIDAIEAELMPAVRRSVHQMRKRVDALQALHDRKNAVTVQWMLESLSLVRKAPPVQRLPHDGIALDVDAAMGRVRAMEEARVARVAALAAAAAAAASEGAAAAPREEDDDSSGLDSDSPPASPPAPVEGGSSPGPPPAPVDELVL